MVFECFWGYSSNLLSLFDSLMMDNNNPVTPVASSNNTELVSIVSPLKLELYKSIVADFRKLTSFCRKTENELKKKYSNLPPATFGSIFSQLVQRTMRHKYRKSPEISKKYYDIYEKLVNDEGDDAKDVIIRLAESQGISPALFARSLLQHVYSDDPTMAKECLKDTNLIDDMELAYHVFMGTMNDNQYGTYTDVIKQAIGVEHEQKLEKELRLMNIIFSDENELRASGYDKTPDFKLEVPVAIDGFIINWVESKALFGDDENHAGYLKDQYISYWNRFGPGLVIYWFGFLETLLATKEVNHMIIIRSRFPDKNSITHYKYDEC